MVNLTIHNEQLNAVYGRTLHGWAIIDQSLAGWFQFLTNLPQDIADLIYYSNQGFMERLNVIVKIVEISNRPELSDFQKIRKKLKAYNEFRNHLVHGSPVMLVTDNDGELGIEYAFRDGKHRNQEPEDHIKIAHITSAGRNFEEAYNILLGMLSVARTGLINKNQDYSLRIDKLPSQAKNQT